MTKTDIAKLLRKYWYVALIVLVVLCALAYIIYNSGRDPKQLLSEYGYLVILVWTFLEGETIVVIAGALSGTVGLEPALIALAAFCGSFLSDQVMFALGKHKGEDVLRYFPRVAKNLSKASVLFKRYDTALILGFRFVYGVRNITPLMLGISGVTHKKFFFLNMIGAAVWAATFTYGGLLAGKTFQRIMHHLGYGILYVLFAVLACAALLWYIRARKNVNKAKVIAERCKEEARQGMAVSPECHDAMASEQQEYPGDPSSGTKEFR